MVTTFDTLMCTTRKNWRVKTLLTIVCLACQAVVWEHLSDNGLLLFTHFVYMFVHVNVWHFLCNMLVLWSIKERVDVLGGIVVAVISSFIPTWYDEITLGMSGFLFAVFGIMWGHTGRFKDCMKRGMPVILLTLVLPGVNGLIHFYCYVLGYVFGKKFSF